MLKCYFGSPMFGFCMALPLAVVTFTRDARCGVVFIAAVLISVASGTTVSALVRRSPLSPALSHRDSQSTQHSSLDFVSSAV